MVINVNRSRGAGNSPNRFTLHKIAIRQVMDHPPGSTKVPTPPSRCMLKELERMPVPGADVTGLGVPQLSTGVAWVVDAE